MAAQDFQVIIPARYASKRLSGKVLLDIDGQPMLQHVYERCIASGASNVYIATCDEAVREVASGFGAQVVMTADTHTSGTERIIEAVATLQLADDCVIVNVQGDEPEMPPEAIAQVAGLTPAEGMATLIEHANAEEIADPDVVKVVCDAHEHALYFSRCPIPYVTNQESSEVMPTWRRHLGIYAYRVRLLKQWQNWLPCAIERSERLEQLRPLYYGVPIATAFACKPVPPGVDNASDLQRVRKQCQRTP
jgi:3-deoxy-manno-octulosonate cytidylyltransferase (CMP-KDO synthetase)